MNTKHTPGPWAYTQAFMSSWDIRRPDGTQMYFLGASTSIPKLEHEANARLIASSPELLEALKDAKSAISEALKGNIEGAKFGLSLVEAAIAKATGEAQ